MNAVLYYAPEIFDAIGTSDTLIPTAITGAVNLGATIVSLYLIKKWTRKALLLTGAAIMFVNLLTLAILLATHAADSTAGGYIAIIVVCIFVSGFAISWGPLCWIYPAEIFPLPIRSKGIALSTAANWIGNLAIGISALQLLKVIEWGFYLILCFFHVLMFIYVKFYVLETSGLSLEEVDAMFAERESKGLDVVAESAFAEKYPMASDGTASKPLLNDS